MPHKRTLSKNFTTNEWSFDYCAGADDLSLPKGTSSSRAMLPFSHAYLSLATVGKIITEVLANDHGISFARDARDLLIECCVEFITLISSEANEIAEKDAKKTIACEHVTAALRQLGYPDYIPEILKVAQEHKAIQAVCWAVLLRSCWC
jgi:histone H3/H4